MNPPDRSRRTGGPVCGELGRVAGAEVLVLGSLPLVTKVGSGNAVSADIFDALIVEICDIFLKVTGSRYYSLQPLRRGHNLYPLKRARWGKASTRPLEWTHTRTPTQVDGWTPTRRTPGRPHA